MEEDGLRQMHLCNTEKKLSRKRSDFLRDRSKSYPVVVEDKTGSVGVGECWALLNQH